MKYLPLPFYQLNRLRGTYSIFAKVNAIIVGAIFGFAIEVPLSLYTFWQSTEMGIDALIGAGLVDAERKTALMRPA